jgi:hypothetical protein
MLMFTAPSGAASWRTLVVALYLVGRALVHQPGDRIHIDAVIIALPLGHRFLVGLGGDDHDEHEHRYVAPGLRGGDGEAFIVERERLGRVDALAEAEGIVRPLGRKGETVVRRARADDLHVAGRLWPHQAIVHLVIGALEVAAPGLPQFAQDLGIFVEHLVAVAEMLVARPHPHLAIFGRCQPVIRLSPNRPWLIESIVLHIRAAKAGGMTSVGQVA